MNNAGRKDELYELLPWYENGTLRGAEREAVRELLAGDLEANRQARELRTLRAAVADEPIMATNMAMNLQRLYSRIDPPPARRPRWFMPTALAAAAILAVAGGLGLYLAGEHAGHDYHVLTDPVQLPDVPAGMILYRVNVAPGVDAVQLAELTGSPGVRILQGPDEHGVSLIAVPGADAKRVLARLDADPRLRFVTTVPR